MLAVPDFKAFTFDSKTRKTLPIPENYSRSSFAFASVLRAGQMRRNR
jgi:hypothetical protein